MLRTKQILASTFQHKLRQSRKPHPAFCDGVLTYPNGNLRIPGGLEQKLAPKGMEGVGSQKRENGDVMQAQRERTKL